MKNWGMFIMSVVMMAWSSFNLYARPGNKTCWYVSGLIVGLVLFLSELITSSTRER